MQMLSRDSVTTAAKENYMKKELGDSHVKKDRKDVKNMKEY